MIVITTPAGDIGARVLRRVLDAKRSTDTERGGSAEHGVRVIARHPSKLPDDVRDRVEIVEGSHAERVTIDRALDGATAVFWLPPGSPTAPSAQEGYVAFSRAFTEALPSSSVRHVVGISALGRGWPEPAGLVSASLAVDDLIGATGVHYRALCCASLMDNIARQVEPIREQGMFFAPTPGDLPLPHVAKRDVAEVAARLLLDRDWSSVEEVPLLGPEDVTHNEMAAIMSDVLGRPIAFGEMPMDQFEGMLTAMGTSEGMVRDYALMMRAKNEGMDTMGRPDLDERSERHALTPTTFRQWCEGELKPAVGV